MKRPRLGFAVLLGLCSFACTPGSEESGEGGTTSTTSDTTTGAESSTSSTTGGETDTGNEPPPLENGPEGSSVMVLSCGPDDGPAWEFRIGRGGGCDMGAPDPDEPYVRITAYDGELLGDPVGTTIEWTDFQSAQGQYAPEGDNGMIEVAPAGSLHIESWEGMPEEGSTIIGWYTLSFEAGEDIGATFEATYCGGDPMCG